MRTGQLLFLIAVLAIMMALWRDLSGRVGLLVFLIGLAEVVCATTALMMLFRTIGALGSARTPLAYFEALFATLIVLGCASLVMTGIFAAGYRLVVLAIRT